MEVLYYATSSGRQPVKKWVNDLDGRSKKDALAAIASLATQDFTSDNRLPKNIVHLKHPSSDVEFRGIDLYEIRIAEKRVYFSKHDDELLLVEAGKSDDSRADTVRAFARAKDYANDKARKALVGAGAGVGFY